MYINLEKPQNTAQQDLFLVIKGWYDPKPDPTTPKPPVTETLRKVLTAHVGVHHDVFSTKDLIFWLVQEFVEKEVILNTPRARASFFSEGFRYLPNSIDFEEAIASALMSTIHLLQCSKEGQWLLSFPQPTPDPQILAALYPESIDAPSESTTGQ